jgi:hypothetical protein
MLKKYYKMILEDDINMTYEKFNIKADEFISKNKNLPKRLSFDIRTIKNNFGDFKKLKKIL